MPTLRTISIQKEVFCANLLYDIDPKRYDVFVITYRTTLIREKMVLLHFLRLKRLISFYFLGLAVNLFAC